MNGQACNVCKYCAELKAPYERSDGAAIYGYCFTEEQEAEAWNRRADDGN